MKNSSSTSTDGTPTPDPVKCPDCGSTQIGGSQTGPKFSAAAMPPPALLDEGIASIVPMLHRGGEFINTCMACGYEWSPKAKREKDREKARKKKNEEYRAKAIKNQLEWYAPWKEELITKLRPILGGDENEFEKWLDKNYKARGATRWNKTRLEQLTKRPFYSEKVNLQDTKSICHPYLRYRLTRDAEDEADFPGTAAFTAVFIPVLSFFIWLSGELTRAGLWLFLVVFLYCLRSVCGYFFNTGDSQTVNKYLCELDTVYTTDANSASLTNDQLIPAIQTSSDPHQKDQQGDNTATVATAEASSGPALFFIKRGDVVKQLSGAQLKAGVAKGQLLPDDLVRKSENDQWIPLSKVKGLTFKKTVKDKVSPVKSDLTTSSDQRNFYYEISGECEGPVSFSQLETLVQQGVVTAQTLIWHDGLEDWTPASGIVGLASTFPDAPDSI